MITESVNDNEEIQEVSARFEEPIEVNVQTISSVDDDDEESKSTHSNEKHDEKPLVANEKVEEISKSDETDHADAPLPPKYEDEFKEAALEEITDENHNKENEVKAEVILPPVEVGWT